MLIKLLILMFSWHRSNGNGITFLSMNRELNGMESLACGRVHVGTGMDLPTRTAYWPTAIVGGLRPTCQRWPT